jgi:hypothetical protein
MNQDPNLQAHRIQTLWTLDTSGDLLTSNEPNPADRQRAPTLHLEWSDLGRLLAFRDDVAARERSAAAATIEANWPIEAADLAPMVETLQRAVGSEGRWSSGPVFIASGEAQTDSAAVRITRANAGLLQGHLSEWQDSIEFEQPMFAWVADGRALSLCATVRRSEVGVEAGVDTLETHRRQGHGRQAVAAWSSAIQREGVTAFYSTSWDNAASIALARSLRLQQVGASLWVE